MSRGVKVKWEQTRQRQKKNRQVWRTCENRVPFTREGLKASPGGRSTEMRAVPSQKSKTYKYCSQQLAAGWDCGGLSGCQVNVRTDSLVSF